MTGRGLAGDRRLVHRRDALDDLAVAGDHVARLARARGRPSRSSRARRPTRNVVAVAGVAQPLGRRLASAAARSVSACALPRPSAIASAKLAKSTVNQSQSAICRVKPMSPRTGRRMSRTSTSVVSTLPTQHHEHHRVPHHVPRVELDERVARSRAGRSAGRTAGAWLSGHVRRASRRCISRCSTIGPSASAGKKVSAPTIRMTPTSSTTNSGVVTGKRARRLGRDLLLGQEAGEREHRDDHREAADQHREPEQRCCSSSVDRR